MVQYRPGQAILAKREKDIVTGIAGVETRISKKQCVWAQVA